MKSIPGSHKMPPDPDIPWAPEQRLHPALCPREGAGSARRWAAAGTGRAERYFSRGKLRPGRGGAAGSLGPGSHPEAQPGDSQSLQLRSGTQRGRGSGRCGCPLFARPHPMGKEDNLIPPRWAPGTGGGESERRSPGAAGTGPHRQGSHAARRSSPPPAPRQLAKRTRRRTADG